MEEQKGITEGEQRRKKAVREYGNLLIVLSWVKSEPIIGVGMLPATKVPDTSPQVNVVDLLSPFSG